MPKKSSIPAGPLLIGLALAATAGGDALARGYGAESSLPFLDSLIDWIGFRELAGDRRDLFGYCLIGFAGAFGYLTDLAFQERGFGKILNGAVGVLGICVALHFVGPWLPLVPDSSGRLRFNLALIACGAGAAVALFFGALIKGVVMRFIQRNLDRLDRPPRPKRMEPPAASTRA